MTNRSKKWIQLLLSLMSTKSKKIIAQECIPFLEFDTWEQIQLRKVIEHFNVDCIFDVGANDGQYATMLREKIGFQGTIVSFEPIPKAAQKVRELSKNDPNWIVKELALSKNDGEQEFHIMSGSQFSSLSKPKHDEVDLFKEKNSISQSISVVTRKLSSVYDELKQELQFQTPFLKLDTQGYDVEIVTNGQPSITQFVGLQSELAIKKIYESSVDYRKAIETYESLGFSLCAFVPNNRGHFPLLVELDCIMLNQAYIDASQAK